MSGKGRRDRWGSNRCVIVGDKMDGCFQTDCINCGGDLLDYFVMY